MAERDRPIESPVATDAAETADSVREQLRRAEDKLKALRDLSAAMAHAVGLDAVLERAVPQVSRIMSAERTTLFFYDRTSDEIWSKVAQGSEVKQIRLKVGQGIAGWVAANRQTALVPDAYDDPRFNRAVDTRTGFRTRSVLAVPLVDRQGQLLGVLQVLNHAGGPFDQSDADLLEAVASQTSYAVENAYLAEQILVRNRELDLLYQLEKETAESSDIDQLLNSMIVRVCERLQSRAGSILLTDQATGQLYFRGVTGEGSERLRTIVLERGQGIVGWVADHGEPVIVNKPEDDPRHARPVAASVNVVAEALLAVPLVWDRRVIGAVEVLNPMARPSGTVGYELDDLKVLTLIAGQIARAIALRRERDTRAQNERLTAAGRMLASVAHDLRNPMTVISGHAQLMALERDGAQRERRCQKLLGQIDEMTAMIGDLLAFSRGDTKLRLALIHVAQLGEEIGDNVRSHCEERGIIFTLTASPDGQIEVDSGRVKRIVYNLAKNAVDVLGRGDKLEVDITPGATGLTIRVADTGPGMSAEVQSRLFTPFFTTGKAQGTGLGLSIVKRFVEDHGGRIEVKSAPGEGTVFTVHLPPGGSKRSGEPTP